MQGCTFRVTTNFGWDPPYALAPAAVGPAPDSAAGLAGYCGIRILGVSWAWHMEDIMCEWEKDQAEQAFQKRLLAFEERHFMLLERMVEA